MRILKRTFLFLFCIFSLPGFAQNTIHWTGDADETTYTNPGNWDTGLPTSVDTVVFDNVQATITNLPLANVSFRAIKIINNSQLTFESENNSITFSVSNLIVDSDSYFALRGSEIITISSSLSAEIEGILDAGIIHVFNFGTGTVNFGSTSEVITANTGGFEASFQGLYNFADVDSFTIYYNGVSPQSTGLLNVGTSFGKIIIENTQRVSMDDNIQISILNLIEGNFNIASYSLTVSDAINYQNGLLAGNNASSLIIGNGSAGTGDSFFVIFNQSFNSLNTLTVNRPDQITDIGSDLTIQNQLNINGGLLRVNYELNTASATIGSSSTNYIIFGNNGYLKQQTAAGNSFQIDVGSKNYFAPILINPVNTDTYTISMHDTVYSNGNSGIPLLNKNVNLRWDISSASNTTFDLTLAWNPSAEIGTFDNTQSYISNYNGVEWDNPGTSPGSSVSGLNTQTRNAISSDGFFAVFSGTNTAPVAANNTVIMLKNSVYVFNASEFNSSDLLAKIMVTQEPSKGNLFLDLNGDDLVTSDEYIASGDQITSGQIRDGLLKFAPITDEFGIHYTSFNFKVSDGIQYSTNDYIMTINVSNNNPPTAQSEQIFTIPEHSPNGTVVGKIEASDPDGNNIFFYPQEGTVYSDAFKLNDDGTITVNNSNLLEYSINPSFTYNIDVCDDGQPMLCTQIRVTINLEEVIRELIPANFISPNGDGYNDRWFVQGLENDVYEVTIFNSNGKLLFHSFDYKNGWDGTSRGRRLPPGVYYYLLRSSNTELKGTITLVR